MEKRKGSKVALQSCWMTLLRRRVQICICEWS